MGNKTFECGGCGTPAESAFFENDRTPADCGFAPFDESTARSARKGSIRLVACRCCGLIQNAEFDPAIIRFEPGYEVELTHSPSFAEFQQSLARRLVRDFDLNGKGIVEIGCGQGRFLKLLCELGGNLGTGIDPTLSNPGRFDVGHGYVELIQGYFPDPRLENLFPDLICSLSVIEDIPDFVPFLKAVHGLAMPNRTPVYFEVFNATAALERAEVWSIHYEQCNYFSQEALENVLTLNGFRISRSGTCYHGDQYLFAEAVPVELGEQPDVTPGTSLSVVETFSSSFQSQLEHWNLFMRTARDNRRKIVLWGSGGKGISFLNNLDTPESVLVVVDINPDRQGRFLPGTGHRIVGPNVLPELGPDVVIATNRIYLEEIRSQVRDLGLRPEFLVA